MSFGDVLFFTDDIALENPGVSFLHNAIGSLPTER
ncbi:hypothetical protein OKW24_000418 [Peribacillus simplex]|nr:hypothetical protein [Peribacillus simplex]